MLEITTLLSLYIVSSYKFGTPLALTTNMKHTTLQRKRVHFTQLFTRAELRIACGGRPIAKDKNDLSTMRAINVKLRDIESLLGY